MATRTCNRGTQRHCGPSFKGSSRFVERKIVDYKDSVSPISSVGQQVLSVHRSSGNSIFGQAKTNRRSSKKEILAGPGSYNALSSFGNQVSSTSRSAAASDFGCASGRPPPGNMLASRNTPGPIYNTRLSAPGGPSFSFTSRVQQNVGRIHSSPGPKYIIPSIIGSGTSVSFGPSNGKLYEGTECRPVSAARSFTGFGFGCNMDEHVRYGRCIDGKCSSRSTWEKTNALKLSSKRQKIKKDRITMKTKQISSSTSTCRKSVNTHVLPSSTIVPHLIGSTNRRKDGLTPAQRKSIYRACKSRIFRYISESFKVWKRYAFEFQGKDVRYNATLKTPVGWVLSEFQVTKSLISVKHRTIQCLEKQLI